MLLHRKLSSPIRIDFSLNYFLDDVNKLENPTQQEFDEMNILFDEEEFLKAIKFEKYFHGSHASIMYFIYCSGSHKIDWVNLEHAMFIILTGNRCNKQFHEMS